MPVRSGRVSEALLLPREEAPNPGRSRGAFVMGGFSFQPDPVLTRNERPGCWGEEACLAKRQVSQLGYL